jgi:hypothetical protein
VDSGLDTGEVALERRGDDAFAQLHTRDHRCDAVMAAGEVLDTLFALALRLVAQDVDVGRRNSSKHLLVDRVRGRSGPGIVQRLFRHVCGGIDFCDGGAGFVTAQTNFLDFHCLPQGKKCSEATCCRALSDLPG